MIMNKELIRDRIRELESEKAGHSWLGNYLTILFGMTTLFLAVTDYYVVKQQAGKIILSLIIYLVIMLPVYFVFKYSNKKAGEINIRIKNNYDLLLGRKKMDQNTWENLQKEKHELIC